MATRVDHLLHNYHTMLTAVATRGEGLQRAFWLIRFIRQDKQKPRTCQPDVSELYTNYFENHFYDEDNNMTILQ